MTCIANETSVLQFHENDVGRRCINYSVYPEQTGKHCEYRPLTF